MDAVVPENLLGFLGISYSRKRSVAESRDAMQQLKARLPDANSSAAYNLARIYVQDRMIDSCFIYLERSFKRREPDFKLLKIDPLFDEVRSDPRYTELYRQYGFDRYR
jgi:hypothetical protein